MADQQGLVTFLQPRWQSLFAARCEVLLDDLTSTYGEADPPAEGNRQFGYRGDKRSDGVPVVMALIVTPAGFPLADEVLAGKPSDQTTLAELLRKIETPYGQAERIWLMDRGIPTEETLATMRQAQPPIDQVVGTAKGRLSHWAQAVVSKPWEQVRESVTVNLRSHDGALYRLAKSTPRAATERAMRRRRLKKRWRRRHQLPHQAPSRDQ